MTYSASLVSASTHSSAFIIYLTQIAHFFGFLGPHFLLRYSLCRVSVLAAGYYATVTVTIPVTVEGREHHRFSKSLSFACTNATAGLPISACTST